MSEIRKTITFIAAAVVLTALALVTAPRQMKPTAFVDQGEPFFPDFKDPNSARTLEVISFDEETGSAKPFKVTFKNGRWTIPSHHDYPADGKDRLAKTAAGVIELKKDDFRSDNVADHEACGVIDPLDETTTTLKGRGQRVTIRGDNDVVLADIIIGKPVEGRQNVRFVRVPGQKRVYASVVDIDLSTKFADWIESDLLLVEKDDIDHVTMHDYSINESTGKLDERDVIKLVKDPVDSEWDIDRVPKGKELDTYKVNQLLTSLDGLTIVGVRPKPEGLSASLTESSAQLEISTSDMMSLQSKGYYFTRDGRLVSNEGEIQIETKEGVIYILRFGEVLYGSGLAVTAGLGDSDTPDEEGSGENRYLFITTTFDDSRFPEPPKAPNTDFQAKADSTWTDQDRENKKLYDAHSKWETKQAERRKLSDDLNSRFARWYYVISSASFDKIHVTRDALLKDSQS